MGGLTKLDKWLVGWLIFAGIAAVWWIWFHVSSADYGRYGPQCADWLSEKFGDGRKPRVIDAWKRKGRIVFEIAIPKQDGDASIMLCVIDKASGTMIKPSLFDQSWR